MIYPGIKKLVAVAQENELTEKYQLSTQDYFLFVGTLEPRKNLALLLDAFETYKATTKGQTQLIIAGGKGWKNEVFEQRLAQHPNKNEIVITGYISNEELSFLYRHAVALIYPSQYEGFGFPVIEAMSVGTAVITTADTSMDEISKPLALTFINNDPLDLSKKMLQIKELNTNSLDQKKREDFTIKYDWTSFSNALLTKLSEVLK
jgi:alpha-1,3-rhamnosyl/mannosyltransferase